MNRMLLLFSFWMFITLQTVVSALPCPVRPPCFCDFNSIDCSSKGLKTVPNFNNTGRAYWSVDLSNNSLTYIPDKAFINLPGLNFVTMKDNCIQSMGSKALAGVEDTLQFLFISRNQMTEIPECVGSLRNITSISLDGNPINDFSTEVFRNISTSLNYLTLGSPALKTWPTSIQYLTALTSLSIRDCPIKVFPEGAFIGLENTLALLSLERCAIERVPLTISTLKVLDVFSIDSNPNLSYEGLPGEAFNSETSPQYLGIRNQSYSTLPDIFHDAKVISKIETNMVPLENIPYEIIPDVNFITDVQFNDTRLREFPKVISKMKSLQTLIIRGSFIPSVSTGALKGLTKLSYFGIFDSPYLSIIQDDVFNDAYDLKWLFLDNTNITTVPKAIRFLRNIRNVSLEGNRVICSCETMGWLKGYNAINEGFFPIGECFNLKGKDLGAYYRENIPKC